MSPSFKDTLESSKQHYSNNWDVTSKQYYELGLYKKLSEKIQNNSNVLEIGCGSGYSTFELSKNVNVLISIDENINCLNNTESFLLNNSTEIQKILRGKMIVNEQEKYFTTKYLPISSIDKKTILIESNILIDESLINFFNTSLRFDYILCWMMGSHQFILNEINQIKKGRAGQSGLRTTQMVVDYKFEVIEKIAQLSHNLLLKNGKIHLAERVNLDRIESVDIENVLAMYSEIYEKYGFQLLQNYEIINIEHNSKIAMVTPDNKQFYPQQLGVISMMFQKVF